jgi:hypothetical protein
VSIEAKDVAVGTDSDFRLAIRKLHGSTPEMIKNQIFKFRETARIDGAPWQAQSRKFCAVNTHAATMMEAGTMDKWKDSSTVGFVGCFFVFLALLLSGAWAAWQILEYNIPG